MTIDIPGIDKPVILEPNLDSNKKQINDGEKNPLRKGLTTLPPTADTVNLSQTAVKLQDVEQQLNSIPIVDQQKVEQLKSAIENGDYQVNFERTADKFLQLESALRR